MKKYSVWLIIGSIAITAGCCGQGTLKPFKLSLSELARNQDEYTDKLIQVKGELNNSGTNYFTDLKITLDDGQGNSIRVQPWLPLSVPPSRPGGPKLRPALLSDYLGKKVRLFGKWVKQEEEFIFQVEKAEQTE